MKIIIIYPHDISRLASHGSGQALLSQLRYYKKMGYQVYLAGYDNNINAEQKKQLESLAILLLANEASRLSKKINAFSLILTGKLNHFIYSKELEQKINKVIQDNNIDIIVAEYLSVAEYLYHLHPGNYKKVLLNDEVVFKKMQRERSQSHNIFRKILLTVQLPIIKKYELKCCRQCDLLLVYSETEKKFLQTYLPNTKIVTMPPIVALPKISDQDYCTGDFNLLFVGNFSHKPNVNAAKYLIKNIFPLLAKKIPEIKLFIVGQPKLAINNLPPNIIITGYVDNLTDYYYKAHLIIAPINTGGGIRIKILEAMSYAKAVITTSVGAEGIKRENNNLIIAESIKEFVDATLNLYHHRESIKQIGLAARKTIESHYADEKINQLLINSRN